MAKAAISAKGLRDTVGANVHTWYGGTPSVQFPFVTAKLTEIGIKHVRSSVLPPQDTRSALSIQGAQALAFAGIKMQAGFYGPPGYGNVPANFYSPNDILNLFGPGKLPYSMISAWEGPNEPDANQSGTQWAVDLAHWYNAIVWSITAQAPNGCPILFRGPAFVGGVDIGNLFAFVGGTSLQQHSGFRCDSHPYRGGTSPWYGALDYERSKVNPYAALSAMGASEFGYTYGPKGSGGQPPVDEVTGAEYTLRSILVHAAYGLDRSFIYQLVDDSESDPTNLLGLYKADWTPRKVVGTLKNFFACLGDSTVAGVPPDPSPPKVSIEGFVSTGSDAFGIPDEIHTLPVQKADGTWQIWIYRTVSIWDRANYAPINVPIQELELTVTGTNWTKGRLCYPVDTEHSTSGPAWHDVTSPGLASLPFLMSGDTCVMQLLP